jgi:hypothetical protein
VLDLGTTTTTISIFINTAPLPKIVSWLVRILSELTVSSCIVQTYLFKWNLHIVPVKSIGAGPEIVQGYIHMYRVISERQREKGKSVRRCLSQPLEPSCVVFWVASGPSNLVVVLYSTITFLA